MANKSSVKMKFVLRKTPHAETIWDAILDDVIEC